MELSELIPHIEALIFASDKPLTTPEIVELVNSAFGFMEDKLSEEQIDTAVAGIAEKYDSEFYPFTIRQSGGGWQFLTKKEYHKTVAQLNGEKFLKRLSAAALETLAIIAYKQPVTKGEIEGIRGVSADYAIQKLLEKELIVIAGRNEQAPGHPLVYTTSKTFMDYFGLNGPADLPKIREVLQDVVVQPTMVTHAGFEESEVLVVSEEGELLQRNEGEEEGAKLFLNGHELTSPETGTGEEAPETANDTSSQDNNIEWDTDISADAAAGGTDKWDEERKQDRNEPPPAAENEQPEQLP